MNVTSQRIRRREVAFRQVLRISLCTVRTLTSENIYTVHR